MNDSRYIIGIDLGTTNIAAFYVDTCAPDLTIHKFTIPQLVATSELAEQDLLPSFCYLPAREELPEGSLRLPWENDPELTVGTFARDQGASSPARQIYSAKSWLAHAGIDRTKPILPWGSDLGDRMMSPIAVTATYLRHLRSAWDHRFGSVKDRDGSPCLMAHQQTVVTIPASFDETARDLTLHAARQAGLREITLLEEPLAAFYAWLNRHEESWRDHLAPGERVLVVDVGGGTTDFSFIEMDEHGTLHRFAVGDHLLLGGDNIDIAIARRFEQEWQTKLSTTDWAMLCQRARAAKEQILEQGDESVNVTLLAKGSSVLQNVRKATITRQQLTDLLEDGFYPLIGKDAPPPKRATGIRQMGLPYAQEPAVTVHLLHFLRYARHVAEGGDGQPSGDILYPHKILFNGGSMKSVVARRRVLAVLGNWFYDQPAPVELAGEDYSLAVAVGAAYYGRVRRGTGVKVRGGISRSYFIKAAGPGGSKRFVCVMSRDTEENSHVEVPGNYRLQANQKVLFDLYSSATRLHDRPGDHLTEADEEELSSVAPLVTVLRYGKGEQKAIDVRLATQLTEIGTLEVVLESAATDHRWPLRFDLRPTALDETPGDAPGHIVVDTSSTEAAKATLTRIFNDDAERLPKLVNELEAVLELERDEWSLPILRELADTCLVLRESACRTPRHEARWLNLAGFCLRPGFGDAADALRMREVWKLWFEGPRHDKQPQVIAEWWVFWRRLAPGLKSGHQIAVDDSLEKILVPKGSYRPKIREGAQAKQEMWRCLASLEQLPPKRKVRLGNLLIERLAMLEPYECWALARLGARHLFHAPINHVVPAADAARWLRRLLDHQLSSPTRRMHLFAISMIGAQTGERNLDVPPELQQECQDFLQRHDAPAEWQERLRHRIRETREEGAQILGDALPIGLHIIEP